MVWIPFAVCMFFACSSGFSSFLSYSPKMQITFLEEPKPWVNIKTWLHFCHSPFPWILPVGSWDLRLTCTYVATPTSAAEIGSSSPVTLMKTSGVETGWMEWGKKKDCELRCTLPFPFLICWQWHCTIMFSTPARYLETMWRCDTKKPLIFVPSCTDYLFNLPQTFIWN